MSRADWFEEGGLHNLSRSSFTDPEDMERSDFVNPEEKMRTWTSALVWVPTGLNKSRQMSMQELLETYTDSTEKFPTAIYLHGCTGLWSGSSLRMKFLADNGILAIGPASLARKKYAQSCNHVTHEGGMYREAVTIRRIDAAHAIERTKELPFVDAGNMLLIGLSEGGITTATFTSMQKDLSVRARVVEGWTCHTAWADQAGVRAPASEPVLSLVGANDPWFREPSLQGHCGEMMNRDNGSKSVVYKTGQLANRHELLEFREVQDETLAFLQQHMDLPMSVKEIQQHLTELGYDPGPVDGAWGAKTLAALNALRADEGLPPVTELDRAGQAWLRDVKDR
ncbi:hypothetical protein A3731_16435 [Roseovarius sp. HI0049]|nr:hypothetical protein A3731_16435 [Roseovarius sp. HI0049]